MVLTFNGFPMLPRREKQLPTRFLLLCFVYKCIWALVEERIATVVSSVAVLVVHVGFYSRVIEKTKAFLTSLNCILCDCLNVWQRA